MVYAVIGAMAFTNAARRDNAHQWLVTRLAGESFWDEADVGDADTFQGVPAIVVTCQVRFTTAAARDLFYIDAVAQLSGAQGPTAGSWIAKHDCPHDEETHVPCVESARQVF